MHRLLNQGELELIINKIVHDTYSRDETADLSEEHSGLPESDMMKDGIVKNSCLHSLSNEAEIEINDGLDTIDGLVQRKGFSIKINWSEDPDYNKILVQRYTKNLQNQAPSISRDYSILIANHMLLRDEIYDRISEEEIDRAELASVCNKAVDLFNGFAEKYEQTFTDPEKRFKDEMMYANVLFLELEANVIRDRFYNDFDIDRKLIDIDNMQDYDRKLFIAETIVDNYKDKKEYYAGSLQHATAVIYDFIEKQYDANTKESFEELEDLLDFDEIALSEMNATLSFLDYQRGFYDNEEDKLLEIFGNCEAHILNAMDEYNFDMLNMLNDSMKALIKTNGIYNDPGNDLRKDYNRVLDSFERFHGEDLSSYRMGYEGLSDDNTDFEDK